VSATETCVRQVDAGASATSSDAETALRGALLDAAEPGAGGCTSWRVDLVGTFLLTDELVWDRAIPLHLVGPAGATARLEAVASGGPGGPVEHRILTAFGMPGAVGRVTLERLVLTGGDVSGVDEGPFSNRGGAVLATDLELVDVELIGNRADLGGAVAAFDLQATRTSFVGNVATTGLESGGAVHAGRNVTLENVTFLANQAGVGGAVWMDAAGVLDATFVTFLGNIADSLGSPGADLHRGTPTGGTAGPVTLRGVLFGGFGAALSGPSCGGEPLPGLGTGLTTVGTFVTDTSCGDAATVVAAPTFGTVPFLTGTSRLPVVVSGVDALGTVACGAGWPTVDQRGLARPQGTTCDAGAVERAAVVGPVPPAPPAPVTPPAEVVQGPVPTSVPAGDGACADGCPHLGRPAGPVLSGR
jgi:adhesin HecA-like repeat protein